MTKMETIGNVIGTCLIAGLALAAFALPIVLLVVGIGKIFGLH